MHFAASDNTVRPLVPHCAVFEISASLDDLHKALMSVWITCNIKERTFGLFSCPVPGGALPNTALAYWEQSLK